MGVWGTSLYANDGTCDVRDTYIGFLQDELNNTEAYEKTLEKCKDFIDDQDEPLLWFALADTQFKVGRLLPEVKAKALEWIERNGWIELWEDNAKGSAGWEKTLRKLQEELESPIRPEKKFRKPIPVNNNPWNLNDIYAYQFYREASKENGLFGKYMLIQKIGEDIERQSGELRMRIHVLDCIYDELPNLYDINKARILPLDFPTRPTINKKGIWMSGLIHAFTAREYPKSHLIFIGNNTGPANKDNPQRSITWGDIDTWLNEFHYLWNGIDYETLEGGLYRYTN